MDKEKGGGSRKSNKDNSTSNQLMAELMFNGKEMILKIKEDVN